MGKWDMGNWDWEKIFVHVVIAVMAIAVIATVAMLCGAITEGLSVPNHTGECLDRGYTEYRYVIEDDEIKMYCIRLRDGTEEVYRLILEDE